MLCQPFPSPRHTLRWRCGCRSPARDVREIDSNQVAVAELVAPLPIPAKVMLNAVQVQAELRNYSVGVDSGSGFSWLVVKKHQTQQGWVKSQLLVWNSHTVDQGPSGPTVSYAIDGSGRSLSLPAAAGKPIPSAACACVVPLQLQGSPCGVLAVTQDGTVLFWPELLKDHCQTITIAFESAHDDNAKSVSLLVRPIPFAKPFTAPRSTAVPVDPLDAPHTQSSLARSRS